MTTTISTRAAGTLNPTRRQLDELDALLQRMLELPVQPLEEPDSDESEEASYEAPPPPQIPRVKETRPAAPPVSYMVVETASPRPLPSASGFETRPAPMTPRARETPIRETPIAPPVPQAGEGEMWVPLRSTWQPSAQTWPPLAESWHQAKVGTPPSTATPANEQIPPPVQMPVEEHPKVVEEPPAPVENHSTAAADQPAAAADQPAVVADQPAANTAALPAPEPLLSLSAADAPTTVPWPLLPLLWFNQGFDTCLAPLGGFGGWLCGPGRQLFGLIGLACLVAAAILAASLGLGWNWLAPLIE